MLSYKQWKSLNESILPSFTLGLGGQSKIGMVMQNSFELEDVSEAKKGKKHPKVEIEVKDSDSKKDKGCGCGKACGKACGKMSKKKMWSDEDDNYEDEDEDTEDMESKKKVGREDEENHDEDEDNDEDNDEDEDNDNDEDNDEDEDEDDDEDDYEDEDDEDEDEENEIKFSKKSKKKMLKGDQHKLDKNRNGRIDAEDFKLMKKKKMGADSIQKQVDYHREIGSDGRPDPKAKKPDFRGGNAHQHPYQKGMKKKLKKEDANWWASVNGMISDPYKKYNDGWTEYQSESEDMFVPIDLDNLTVAIREPAPGEVGFAPSGKLNGQLGSFSEAAKWVYHQGDLSMALKGDDGKPKVFSSMKDATDATETYGGKAVKHKDGYIVVKFKKVPSQEELKDSGSFRSGEYEMPGKGDREESRRTIRQDARSRRVSTRSKKLPD